MPLDPLSFPDAHILGNRAMALAMLDAIICPEREYRYFHFDAERSDGARLGAMRNGDGDHWLLHLSENGALLKGYVQHLARGEARAMAREVRRRVPFEFDAALHDPALLMDTVSYCYWQRPSETGWRRIAHPEPDLAHCSDGSADYLSILLAPADAYYDYATDYFECAPSLASIEHIYAHAPLTAAIVNSLNARLSLEDAQAAAAAIGYPQVAQRQPGLLNIYSAACR